MTEQKEKHENSDIPISLNAYDNLFRENRKLNNKTEFDSFFWSVW